MRLHEAFKVVQRRVYAHSGTIRQFLQDDKGLVVISVFGMPPFEPHADDPVRASVRPASN